MINGVANHVLFEKYAPFVWRYHTITRYGDATLPLYISIDSLRLVDFQQQISRPDT